LQSTGLTAVATELLPILCSGGSATIDVTASGGTAPYTGTGTTTSTAGLQTFTVSDANGCTASATITILEPAALSASVNVLNPIACNGGFAVIDVIASGGTPTYTGVGTFPGIAAGTYTYNISDANGCTASASITLTEPAVLSASIASQTNVACNGGNTGSIDATVTGGTSAYTYSWSNTATSEDLTSLTAGTYTLSVTDANGCTASTSTSITEPTALALTPSMTPASCNPDGTASIAVGGGTASYTYLWSNNATTSTISGLNAGTYSVTVTDANGCSAISSINVLQSTGLTAVATELLPILCSGGSATIDVTASGGTAPYTGTGTTTSTAGLQTFTVSDANGCTASTTLNVVDPGVILLNVVATDVTCFGANDGSVTSNLMQWRVCHH